LLRQRSPVSQHKPKQSQKTKRHRQQPIPHFTLPNVHLQALANAGEKYSAWPLLSIIGHVMLGLGIGRPTDKRASHVLPRFTLGSREGKLHGR
jgi:hypothetical protein